MRKVLVVGIIVLFLSVSSTSLGINVNTNIDNELRGEDITPPYSWTWDEIAIFFPYTINVVAYDNAGNQDSDTRKVWKIG